MASDTCGNIVADSMIIEVNDTLYQIGNAGLVNIADRDNITLYFNVAPNPFKQGTDITFNTAKDAYVDLDLYSNFGIRLRSLYSGFLTAGSEVQIPLKVNNMVHGMYLLVLKTRYGTETRRIIMKR